MLYKTWEFFKSLAIAAFLAFFCIRGFIAEPFKIPSSSMEPTLLIGDFLVVSKYAYGTRFPMTNYFFRHTDPKRGDIIVFKKKDEHLPGSFFGFGDTLFIKRLVGLPGDRIAYHNQTLYINGNPVSETPSTYAVGPTDEAAMAAEAKRLGGENATFTRYLEHLTGGKTPPVDHIIQRLGTAPGPDVAETTVPPDMFVMMGDNRDNSLDSRFWAAPAWGYVPRQDLMGRAEFIFFSWGDDWIPRFNRIGTSLRPTQE